MENDLSNLISFIRTEPVSLDNLTELESENFYKPKYEARSFSVLQNNRYNLNTKLRKGLSTWAACIVSFWLLTVSIILFKNNDWFCLSDSVLITLLTTTTINILGIIAIVMYDIFNGKSEDSIGKIS